jgi:hypothetical protein
MLKNLRLLINIIRFLVVVLLFLMINCSTNVKYKNQQCLSVVVKSECLGCDVTLSNRIGRRFSSSLLARGGESKFCLVEREDLGELVKELEFANFSGLTDSENRPSVGKFKNIQGIFLIEIVKRNGLYSMSIKYVNITTTETIQKTSNNDLNWEYNLDELADNFAASFASDLNP